MKIRLVNKTRFVSFIIVVIVVVALAFVVAYATNDTPNIISYDTYIVHSGDTLWEIAQTSNGYGRMDIRVIIHDIETASDLDTSNISCGDVLQIPIYEEGK